MQASSSIKHGSTPDAQPSKFSRTSGLCYHMLSLQSCVWEAQGTRRHCKLYSPFLFCWSVFGNLLYKTKMTYNKSKWTTWIAIDQKSVILINPNLYCHPTRATLLLDGFIIKVLLTRKQVFKKILRRINNLVFVILSNNFIIYHLPNWLRLVSSFSTIKWNWLPLHKRWQTLIVFGHGPGLNIYTYLVCVI